MEHEYKNGNGPATLLFVDDEPRVLDSIQRYLRSGQAQWEFNSATSVDDAIRVLESKLVDVVVTDLNMPHRDGFSLLKAILENESWKRIPVIVLTGRADATFRRQALQQGAFDLLGKPISREDLIVRLQSVLRIKSYEDSLAQLNASLEEKVRQRTAALETSRSELLMCLAAAGESRDPMTGQHVVRVGQYSRCLAEAAGLSLQDVDLIFRVAPLHDIGKLGVPDHILNKPGRLSPEERQIVERHCEVGHRILTAPFALAHHSAFSIQQRNSLLAAAAEVALSHHERWDGTGYPERRSGESIPLPARIVAIADVYDALTTERPYKQAMGHEESIRILSEGSGSHFDPQLIKKVCEIAPAFSRIREQFADDSEPSAALSMRAAITALAG